MRSSPLRDNVYIAWDAAAGGSTGGGVRVAASSDHGASFSIARADDPSGPGRAIGASPSVGPNGELLSADELKEQASFAREWHILMKGSIVAAGEGDVDAALRAQRIGRVLLAQAPVGSRGRAERAPASEGTDEVVHQAGRITA